MFQREIESAECRCGGTGVITLHPKKGRASIGMIVCACAAGRAIPVRVGASERREMVRYG